jgi:hypothetical protein
MLGSGLGIGLGLSEAPSTPVALTARFSAGLPTMQSRTFNSTTIISFRSSISLPTADAFARIAIQNGVLVLTGELTSTVEQQTPTCVRAPIDSDPLKVGAVTEGSCSDPASSGATVGTLTNELPGSNNATFGLVVDDPATGSVSAGPTLFTFCDCSDTRPVIVTEGGWIWVYDVTLNGPELIQASATTGRVVDTMPMPSLFRPNIVAGDGGLWIGNSLDGGACAGCQAALYFVAPGATAPTPVVTETDLLTCWLVGDGDRVWVGMGSQHQGCVEQSVWKFVGTARSRVFEGPDQTLGSLTVVGDEADGLWTVRWAHQSTDVLSTPDHQQVVRIDPDTGVASVVTSLPKRPIPGSEQGGLVPGQAVVEDRSLYLLEPPFRFGAYLGYDTLLRFQLHSRASSG